MLRQYFEIKDKHKDKILFFRLGDFYEMFGADAEKASIILDIVLTARHKGTEHEIPMCGLPYHAAEQYIAKLTKAGLKVAICEQVSDPSLPGIVKREVVQIITPGTTMCSSLLEKGENNFLVSVASKRISHFSKGGGMENGYATNKKEEIFGVAFVDLTTGEFKLMEILGYDNLITELKRINPAEMLVDNGWANSNQCRRDEALPRLYNDEIDWYLVFKNVSKFVPAIYFEPDKVLCEQFGVSDLRGFGIENLELGIRAAANLVMYLKDTQKTQLAHITKISVHNPYDYMILDETTIRNLDLIYNLQMKSKEGTLISVLDKTSTAMGARLLRQWILHPLIKLDEIKRRLEIVEYFFSHNDFREELRTLLTHILDIERVLSKICCLKANARDLIALKESLRIVENIKSFVSNYGNGIEKFNEIGEMSSLKLEGIIELIENKILDDPPVIITEGGIIKEGHNSQLDELRKISEGGKSWIAQLQQKERERTGINSLKIKFNRIFGYYIEISNANITLAPQDYMRKQTLVNGERFITPELKEYEEKVLTAEEKIKEIEYSMFFEITSEIAKYSNVIQKTASIIAELDIFLDFAQIARENNYTIPYFSETGGIEIKEGRHPVLEHIYDIDFIANDSYLNNEKYRLMVLTGPNMAGKSVYLRQNALICLMAQIGSFVPAKEAKLCVLDRIFTRVGASDNIVKGQSTFMVEMQEAAKIINTASEKSLIIFDELGRGTSTYDGVSIAWAVIEYIHNKIKAKTIFATHYHELAELADNLEGVQNYRMAVLENEDGVVFLHKIIKGGIDKSYGIEVAKLAGMPKELVERAREILKDLENGQVKSEDGNSKIQPSLIRIESEVEKKIKELDLNNMTPMEVVSMFFDLQKKLNN
ncbi:MAG: DNA mismatch repair protein MutS [bacterium]